MINIPTDLTPKIFKLIELFELYQVCCDRFRDKTENLKSMNDMESHYRYIKSECNNERNALWEFCDSLTIHELLIIQSIMYAGRDFSLPEEIYNDEDQFDDFGDHQEHVEHIKLEDQYNYFKASSDKKEIIFHNIIGKKPMVEYLKHGLIYYKNDLL